MSAWYNECDPFAAEWLRNLIDAGHIAPGIVDERKIQEIEPYELTGFTQCHFFAGIGVWSYALRRVGWPDDRPIWSGSCPCQPWSNSGQKKGIQDERHVWPTWEKLISVCKPSAIIGEQVASKDGLGWLDIVSADLEISGYAFGATDLCAAGFSGAHIRQRLYFLGLADAESIRSGSRFCDPRSGENAREWSPVAGYSSSILRVADSDREGLERRSAMRKRPVEQSARESGLVGSASASGAPVLGRNVADWLFCRDGKWRPVEPGTFPLAYAAPARVGRLRAYGNALDAETATQFCTAVKEICDGV
jgi:DNA (cytosine-5)-methyltransferase 1